MVAIRAARAFTGKRYVIKMGGGYHGWSDQVVYGLHVPGTRRREARGIPAGATRDTQEVAGALKMARWVHLTGGMPSTTGKDPAGHMLLVREELPEVYEKTYKFLNVLDFLNLRLTGHFTATFDSILTSWVTDNRNPDRIRYDGCLLRLSGIDGDKFPDIVPCTTVLGPLRPDVATELGLSPDVQVVAGAIDNTAAAVGSGAVEDYAPHLYVGTSSWVAAHVPFKKTDPLASLASVPCAIPGRYLLTAGASSNPFVSPAAEANRAFGARSLPMSWSWRFGGSPLRSTRTPAAPRSSPPRACGKSRSATRASS